MVSPKKEVACSIKFLLIKVVSLTYITPGTLTRIDSFSWQKHFTVNNNQNVFSTFKEMGGGGET